MQSMIKPTTRHKVYIKSKLSARIVLLWHEHTLAKLAPFIDGFIHDRLLQSTAPRHTSMRRSFSSVMSRILVWSPFAASYPRFYSQQDSDLGCWVATDLVRWILEYHIEEAEECLVLCVRVHCLVERQRNSRTFHGWQAAVPTTATLLCSILRSPWCPDPQRWDQ